MAVPVTKIYTVSSKKDDSRDFVPAGYNVPHDSKAPAVLTGGDKLTGYQYGNTIIFRNLDIPKGAIITNAYITLKGLSTSHGNNSTYPEKIRYGLKDGIWDADSVTGWRTGAAIGDVSFAVYRLSDGTAVVNNIGTPNVSYFYEWNYQGEYPARQMFGQSWTATEDFTLKQVDFYLSKCQLQTIYVDIYASDGNDLPTGSVLATSDGVSGFSGNLEQGVFPFSGANQISITSGNKYVAVLRSSVSQGWGRVHTWGGYSGGTGSFYGTGVGVDNQNYMVSQDVFWNSAITKSTTSVDWYQVATIVSGTSYNTSALTTLVQEWVNLAGYVENTPIMFRISYEPALIYVHGDYASAENVGSEPKLTVIYYIPPIEKALQYAIRGVQVLQKSAKYAVKTVASLAKGLQYEMSSGRVYPYSQSDNPYDKTVSPISDQGRKYTPKTNPFGKASSPFTKKTNPFRSK